MTNTNHTPGPWTIEDVEPGGHTVITGMDMVVARVAGPEGGISRDANLIAAAPAMLEALQRIAHFSGNDQIRQMAESAIAKAKGA